MSEKKVRVRFAPSPTGPLHIGGVRTALYNYLFAKKHGGDFILRIEDTDQTRYVKGAEDYIIESLQWCGLHFDEGPIRQSSRKETYQNYATELLEKGHAYYAFDTPQELDAQRQKASNWQYDSATRGTMKNSLSMDESELKNILENSVPYVVRIKIPEDETIIVNDLIRGRVEVNSGQLDDKVLFKSDGMPTYHLANVVDDHLMEISHVIRGEEWLPSAPLHVLLYLFLGWQAPQFAHLPLILKPEGSGKLSKRDGDRLGFPVFPLEWKEPETGEVSSGYREKGYFPDAFINMLALLGWNPGTEQELFSLNELIEEFSLEKVQKGGARFDPEKAKWFNQQYLWQKSDEELATIFPIQREKDFLRKVCGLMKERVHFVHEIYEHGRYFFEAPENYDEKTVRKKWKERSSQIVSDLTHVFSQNDDFQSENLETAFKKYVEEKELGFGAAMISLRLVITGVGGGPPIFEIMSIIGRNESLERMKKGVEKLSEVTTS